jgi:hypothetical protein
MDGFKDSTKMKYMKKGGPVKMALGGDVPPTRAPSTAPATTAKPVDRYKPRTDSAPDVIKNTAMVSNRGTRSLNQAPEPLPYTKRYYDEGGNRTTSAPAPRGAAPAQSSSKIITPEDKAKYAAEINTPYRETKPVGSRAQAQNARTGPVKRAKGGPAKKAIGGGVDAKLSRGITNIKAQQDRMAAAPSFDPSKPSSGSASFSRMLGLPDKTVAPPVRGPSMASPHSNRPMVRRKTGGLAVMPGKKC